MIRGSFSGSTLSLCLLVAAALSGCKSTEPRTQVMVVVDADADVRPKTTSLRVEIDRRTPGTEDYTVLSDQTYPPVETEAMTWPYKIALVPRGGDEKREFRITVTAFNDDVAIARLRAESGFVPRKTIELALRFQGVCLNRKSLDCLLKETCLDGACVPSRIDQGTLPNYTDEPDVNIPVGDGGPMGTTSNPTLMAGTSGAAGSGGTGAGGMSGGPAIGPDIDPTMPPNCGDGKLTGDEKCDTAIPEGMGGACPKECRQATACERPQLEGSGCQTRCTPYKITALESGDMCCPEGADANSDADCRASCGNNTIESGEACDPVEMCPTAATCVSANVCLKATVIGDPAACTATCQMQPIIECMSGDGCCPANCNNGNDTDCSASCGDGVITGTELCEKNSTEKPCPTTCDDGNACTTDLFTGSADNCNSACTNVAITAPKRDDGCCPPGANANNDNDCKAMCGNRIVESGERCDGRCPTAQSCNDGNACTTDMLMGSDCSVQCTHAVIVLAANGDGCCPALLANATNDDDCDPVCGNAVVEEGERCDGNCPTAQSCNDNQACTRDEVTGNPCQRVCQNTALGPSGATKDGCCPGTGMTTDTDADCPPPKPPEPVCPNGKVETGEDCDGNCPPLNDNNPCTRDTAGSTPCKNPTHTPISASPAPDGVCCPAGSKSDVDADCPDPEPVCGNDKVEDGEDCDGNCPPLNDNNPCTKDAAGSTPCKNPTHTPISASPAPDGVCCPAGSKSDVDADCPDPEPVCGNGKVEDGERCDGNCPTAASCNDNQVCTNDDVTGDPCQRQCSNTPLGPSGATVDGCCPGTGMTSETDADCPPPAPGPGPGG